MKKILPILTLFLALIGTGCMQATVNGSRRVVIFPQTGVMLQILNQCTPDSGVAISPDGRQVHVAPGAPTYLPLIPTPFTNAYNISATYQVYRGDVLVGSVTRSFYIDRQGGTRIVQWVIGGNGGGDGYTSVVDNVYSLRSGTRIC